MPHPGAYDGKSASNGEQLDHRGWEQVSDTQYTSGSPLVINQNVRTLVPNNAGAIINSQIPLDITTFWDPINSKFIPDRVGDFYILRYSGVIVANNNNTYATLELDIGGSQGVIWTRDIALTKGANVPVEFAIAIPLYTLQTFVTNGGQFYIETTRRCDLYDISLVVFRTFRGRD